MPTAYAPGYIDADKIEREDVYPMRMARVNVSLPDDLHEAAKALGINISAATRDALRAILSEQAKMAEWDRILAEDLAANPPTPEQWAEARAWAKDLAARIQADDENDAAA